MFSSLYRGLVRLLEWILITAMALLVFDVLWGVISRSLGTFRAWIFKDFGVLLSFLPSGQSPWTEELARFLLMWVGLLGAALAFARGGHLGVDYFVGKLHPDARRWMRSFVWLIVLFFAWTVLCRGGWDLTSRTFAMKQETPALGIAKGWVYLAVPISGLFTLLFGAVNLVRSVLGQELPGQEEDPAETTPSEPRP